MKYTNEQIREMYEREGGPELHADHATDAGIPTTQVMLACLILIVLVAVLIRVT